MRSIRCWRFAARSMLARPKLSMCSADMQTIVSSRIGDDSAGIDSCLYGLSGPSRAGTFVETILTSEDMLSDFQICFMLEITYNIPKRTSLPQIQSMFLRIMPRVEQANLVPSFDWHLWNEAYVFSPLVL